MKRLAQLCRRMVKRETCCKLEYPVKAVVDQLERRLMLSVVSWDGGGDGTNWTDALNWSENVLPTINDDVTIASGSTPMKLAGGSQATYSARSLSSQRTIDLYSGVLNLAQSSQVNALEVEFGTLSGAGDLTITNSFDFDGQAYMTGPGKTVISAGATGTIRNELLGRSIDNYGTVNVVDNAAISGNTFVSGFTLNNYGTLNLLGTATFGGPENNIRTDSFLNNFGTIHKSGSGTATFQGIDPTFGNFNSVTVANTGIIELDGGTLQFNGAHSTSTSIEVKAGTRLVSSGLTFGSNAGLSGSGEIDFTGGIATIAAGLFTPTGNINFTSGNLTINNAFTPASLGRISAAVTFNGQVNYSGLFDISNRVVFNATQTISRLKLDANVYAMNLSGIGDLTITDRFDWLGGNIGGSGKLILPAGCISTTGTGGLYSSRRIDNFGTANFVDGTGMGGDFSVGGFIFDNYGTLNLLGAATFGFQENFFQTDSFINNFGTIRKLGSGAVTIQGDSAVPYNAVTLANNSVLDLRAGQFTILGATTVGAKGVVQTALGTTLTYGATVKIQSVQSTSWVPAGNVRLTGGQIDNFATFEVMSEDRGNIAAGYDHNFAIGSITVTSAAKLVNETQNSNSALPEALYVDSLVVKSGYLDLNGFHVYARAADIKGEVRNGVVSITGDGGPLLLGLPVPGNIATVDEIDDWTVFGRAGHAITLLLQSGIAESTAAPLTSDEVEVIGPDNSILASANNVVTGAGTSVTLSGVQFPADGIYHVLVHAPKAVDFATGHYTLTAYDASVNRHSLTLGNLSIGSINSPYAVDQWNFTGSAGEVVQFHPVNASASGIAYTLTGPDGFTAFTDTSADSLPILLPASGAYSITVRSTNGQSADYSFKLSETTAITLTPGMPYAGELVAGIQSFLFKVDVPTEQALSLKLEDPDDKHSNQLFLKFGSQPTQVSFDQQTSSTGPNQRLLVPAAIPGTWWVLMIANSVSAGPFSLIATEAALKVSSASPDHSGNSVAPTLVIRGAGFIPGTTVALVSQDGASTSPTAFSIDSFSQISATFAAGLTPGKYTLKVNNGLSSDSLSDFFTITELGTAHLETKLVLPDALGGHSGFSTLYIQYSNTGTVAMPAPVIQLSSPDPNVLPIFTLDKRLLPSALWGSQMPPGCSSSITILASGATPGVLNPGESVSVPVYSAGVLPPAPQQISIGLSVIQSDSFIPMNWSGQTYVALHTSDQGSYDWVDNGVGHHKSWDIEKTFLADSPVSWVGGQPPSDETLRSIFGVGTQRNGSDIFSTSIVQRFDEPGVSQLAPEGFTSSWDVIFRNLQGSVGGRMGDWVQILDEDAAYLARQGIIVNNVNELWAFEVEKASGLGPQRILDSSVDASMIAPGVDLSFSRSYLNPIPDRSRTGPFGYGWASNWNSSLSVDSGGAVTISSNGQPVATYTPDLRHPGVYFSALGDTSVLSRSAGDYDLRDPNGIDTHFDANGVLRYVRDSNGNQVTAGYTSGRLTTLAHSSGASITIAYNDKGTIDHVTDSAGRTTAYGYDDTGAYLLSATTDDGKITRYTYQTSGVGPKLHALLSIEQGAVSQHFAYDDAGRLSASFLDGNQQRLDYTYGLGGEVDVSDGIGTTKLFYDYRGLLVKTIDALGNTTSAIFDGNSRLSQLIAPTGETQNFVWNAQGDLIKSSDELGQATNFTYNNSLNRLTSFTDARNNTTRYAYDDSGNLLSTTYADDSFENFGDYTASGLPQTYTNRRLQPMRYEYYPSGQTKRQTLADGSFNDFVYDARGNLLTVTEHPVSSVPQVTSYAYDYASDGDRLKKVTYPNGRFLTYTYDSFGRRQAITDQDGYSTLYDYDSAGRLWHLRDGAQTLLASYSYFPDGRLERIEKGNGTYTTYQYDDAGQLLHLVNFAPDGSVNSRFDYTYDSRGRRTAMSTLDGNWTYGYDATGQLIHAVFASNDAAVIANQDLTYHYDAAGNRDYTIVNGVRTEYAANELNEYTSVGGVGYQYDADGNLTFDGTNTYIYDQQNHLNSLMNSNGLTQFEYDPFGNDTAVVRNGSRSEYLNDATGEGNKIVEYDAVGHTGGRNTYGLGLIDRITSMSQYFYDFDALGSTAGISDSTGRYVNKYVYSPFGGTLLANESLSNEFQFVGQLGVESEGEPLYSMRNRRYNVAVGRFISNDPIGLLGGTTNFTEYTSNNPVNLIDPAGLVPRSEIGDPDEFPHKSEPVDWSGIFGGPWYGNYAGPGNNGMDKLWIDSVDFATFEHDKAYDDVGADGVAFAILDTRVIGADAKLAFYSFGSVVADWSGQLGVKGNTAGLIISGVFTAITIEKLFLLAAQESFQAFLLPAFSGFIRISVSQDPNDKSSPAGFGPSHFINDQQPISYRIRFENVGPGSVDPKTGNPYIKFATAPAHRVTITDQLSSDLDWSTFRLGQLGFGDAVVDLPTDSQHYQGVVSMTYNGQTFDVDLEAGIDLSTGLVSVVFQSLDPLTGLPPEVLAGFLPPEDGTGRGKGYFTYTVNPGNGLATGTQIRNVALISFDGQAVIATDQVDDFDPYAGTDPTKPALNTIDSGAPTSNIAAMPPQSPGRFLVEWTGQDDSGGSGLANYDVYVSDNGAPAVIWLSKTDQTQGVYIGQQGHTYSFYTIAYDNVGNAETAPPTPDATTTIVDGTAPRVISAEFDGHTPLVTLGHYLTVQFTENVQTSLSVASVKVHNLTTGQDLTPTSMTYHAQSNTMVVTLGSSIPDGNYTLTLNGQAIFDQAGNALDGDSDGSAGGDFTFSFFSLLGDVNHDRIVDDQDRSLITAALGTSGVRPQDGDANGDRNVDFADLVAVAQHYGRTGTTLSQGDFNGDNIVDFADLVTVAQHYGKGGQGDLNGDNIINQLDLDILKANYGHSLPAPGAPVFASEVTALVYGLPEKKATTFQSRASFKPPAIPVLANAGTKRIGTAKATVLRAPKLASQKPKTARIPRASKSIFGIAPIGHLRAMPKLPEHPPS